MAVFSCPLAAQDSAAPAPDLNFILDCLEHAQSQDPAFSKPHDVTREYKLFRGDNPNPSSDVTAQIAFTPPDIKTFSITDVEGSSWGRKVVADTLEHEARDARDRYKLEIDRANYDFSFVRTAQDGGGIEYVLHIVPKRRDPSLLLGEIWVNARNCRILQIVGVPATNPSFWVRNLHLTLRFTVIDKMWILDSVNAVADVRFLGVYKLTGVNLPQPISASSSLSP